MTRRIKIALTTWLNPRAIILGFSVFNFMIVWVESLRMRDIACVVCPWCCDLGYTSEPIRLLIAAVLLWLGRTWSYAMACALSTWMCAYFVYLFIAYDVSVVQEWRYLRRFEPYVVGSFDGQYILAFIVLIFAAFYLTADLRRKYFIRNDGV